MDRRDFVKRVSVGVGGAAAGSAIASPVAAAAAAVEDVAPATLASVVAEGAVFGRAPLAALPYAPLPLGAVVARGWLDEQLRLMADGLAGRLDEVYPLVGRDNAWLGGAGDTWERGPYWLDGLVPLAHLRGDARLLAKAQTWVDHALASQLPNGYFGPPDDAGRGRDEGGVQRANSADWWPRMVMLKVLQQHHEATGDARVLPFMTRYFAYQRERLPATPLAHWTRWAQHRGGENQASAMWLYDRTGEPALLDLVRLLAAQTSDWTDGLLREQPPSTHGVNVAMGLKQPGLEYRRTRDPRHLRAVDHGLAFLRRDHGQITGMFSGDEPLHGTDPLQGTELCTVVELMHSLETMLQLTGRVAHADQLERVAYNALPAQVTDDYMARQYFQQPNQVRVDRAVDHYVQQHGGTAHLMGLLTGYPCCTVNMHQGWPKLVRHLWLASADGGLAALVYGPSRVTTRLGDATVSIDEETAYPFGDGVRLVVHTDRAVDFPLHLRVPSWAEGATVRVNGQPHAAAAPGTVARLARRWREGDEVELRLPARVAVGRWHKGLAGVERGPLVYALRIDEDWRRVGETNGVATFEVYPRSAWNYALRTDLPIQATAADVRPASLPARPWRPDVAPVTLSARAQRLPNWTVYHHVDGTLPYSPVATSEPLETITLVPYGCTTLRLSEFPVAAV
jgi:hypothetical protein